MPADGLTRAQVLVVEDCPNADLTVRRLRQALDHHGAADVEIEVLVITPGSAPPDGFAGSPTILLDGVDPFAPAADRVAAPACRLYPTDGSTQSPTTDALAQAVQLRTT